MYIADKEIKDKKTSKRKTLLGQSVIDVTFIDGSKKEYNEKIFNKIASEEKSDLTKLREDFCFPIAEDILKILLDYEVPISYMEFLVQSISKSLNTNLDVAEETL
jgi:hypothetical protein